MVATIKWSLEENSKIWRVIIIDSKKYFGMVSVLNRNHAEMKKFLTDTDTETEIKFKPKPIPIPIIGIGIGIGYTEIADVRSFPTCVIIC